MTQNQQSGIKTPADVEAIVIQSYEAGKSMVQITGETGASHSTVYAILRRNNIPRKRRGNTYHLNAKKKAADPKKAAERKARRDKKKAAKPAGRMCSCCGQRAPQPPNRMLCNFCWRNEGNYFS